MDKPTKPTDLIPRSFGGVKNNFSESLQSSGYEDDVPAIYGGDNLNYQLDATGKELDYCEKICDYINAIPIGKTPVVNANNKLVYTQYDIRVYDSTETYFEGDFVTGTVDGEKNIYRSLVNDNTGHALSDTTYWLKSNIIGSGGNVRNIGEIITSTLPLTDAGLHLLDGARLSGDGIYKEFVQYIADLYAENPNANYFTTESAWQNSVTTYGSCGKFVYDSTLNTVRLPKVSDILQCTTDINALGNLIEAGLPMSWLNHTHTRGSMNITGGFWYRGGGAGATAYGAFATGTNYSGQAHAATAGDSTSDISFDASRTWTGSTSSPNYSNTSYNASTVQPQTIKALLYIVIATSTKTDIEVDIDEIATDLNGKADVDLSNLSATGILNVAKMALGSIHYDANDFSKIGAFWGVTDLTSGSVSLPANGYWLTFLYRYNASGTASDIGSSFSLGIDPGGTSITVSGSYPHWYWFGIRIKE